MSRVQKLEGLDDPPGPHRYFDVIAGTGTGAIEACMLGRLQISVEQAIEFYGKLVKNVFSERKIFGSNGSAFKLSKLKKALMEIVGHATGNENELMMDKRADADSCKTIVFAMSSYNLNAGIPTVFRSYQGPANQGPDCSIWEALCATMAHPDLFKSVNIGEPPLMQSFVGGGLGCNNPIMHVLAEVKALYPEQHVASIISIGAGHTRTIRIPKPTLLQRVLSTNVIRAIQDIATDSERVAQEMEIRFQGMVNVYFRLSVDQGLQKVKQSEWERLGEVTAHANAYTRRLEINQKLEKTAQAITERRPIISTVRIDGQIQAGLSEHATLKRCPAPTPVFIGREDEIYRVENCVLGPAHERRVCVIHGLGGAGKTQLALKVIERTREKWTQLLYVDASSQEAIESTMQAFAVVNKIGKTHEDTIQWLESCREPWLLVFDNADAPSLDLHRYFPNCNHGSILITTRLHDMALLAQGPDSECNISGMSPQEALELLLKTARRQGQSLSESEMGAATGLLKNFGYLALAIVHAGAYIGHSPHMSISKYRKLFLARRRTTLDEYVNMPVKVDDYQKTVYTTWKMCYDLLGPNARPMMWIIAFLHYDSIREDIFRRALINLQSHKPVPSLPSTALETTARKLVKQFLNSFLDSEGHWDSLKFSRAINEISSYSLIEYDRANQAYSIHVLVQDWARTTIPYPPSVALECTTTLLSLSIDHDHSMESRIFRRSIGQHVSKVLSERQEPISPIHAAQFAMVYIEKGQWKELGELLVQARETTERVLGKDNPNTLAIVSNLACVYREQGRWDEAEKLDVQVLHTRKRVLGPEHRDTLTSMNNLASTYQYQGLWDRAEALHVQVLDIRRRVLGGEDPDTLASMSNLAFTYRNRGRWDEAETLGSQVFNAFKRVLGKEHPTTLTSMSNLATTYRKQDRWQEAEPLYVQVLEARKRVLGEEHPDTLQSVADLVDTYLKLGQWDNAEGLQAQVVELLKRIHLNTPEHPHTLLAMEALEQIQLEKESAVVL